MTLRRAVVSKFLELSAGWLPRGFVAAIAVLSLATIGCKKSVPPSAEPQQQPAHSTASTQPASFQEMFDLKSHPDATILHPVDLSTLSETEKKFGVAPKRDASVEYQPDIILMEQGDKSIRAQGTDGMTWTFDANAPHVNELQMGKIVFATGRAVGRIISMKRQGNDVSVVLGPIQITDVIHKASVAMDTPIDLNNVLVYVAPDFPQPDDSSAGKKTSGVYPPDGFRKATVVVSRVSRTGKWQPMSMSRGYGDGRREVYRRVGKRWLPLEAAPAVFRQSNSRSDFAPQLTPAAWQGVPLPGVPGVRMPQVPSLPDLKISPPKNAPIVNILGGGATLKADASGIGVQYTVEQNGLSFTATGMVNLEGAGIKFYLDIGKGKIPISCGLTLTGVAGIRLHLKSHSTQEFHANIQKRIWLPVGLSIPITGPMPLSISFEQALIINTGFSAKNSILNADGQYLFKGEIGAGLNAGGWLTGSLANISKKTDIGDSIEGVSVGINSLVLGAELRTMAGLGMLGFTTGVYATLRFTGTLLRAPDIAMACRQGTIEAWIDSGVGYAIPQFVTDAINYALSFFTDIRIDRAGSLLKGPSKKLFDGITKIPDGCSG